jgi:hypothetical protein
MNNSILALYVWIVIITGVIIYLLVRDPPKGETGARGPAGAQGVDGKTVGGASTPSRPGADIDPLTGCHWYDPICGACYGVCASAELAGQVACDTVGEIPEAAYLAAVAACYLAAAVDQDLIDNCDRTFPAGSDPISLCNVPVTATAKACKSGCYKV